MSRSGPLGLSITAPSRLPDTLEEALVGTRFFLSLPLFLRRPLSLPEARRTLKRRLARREADFLRLVVRGVFGRPDSPYRKLFELAGCEPGDLQKLLEQDRLEGALESLLDKGVYLTIEEFKGRRPVTRGSSSFELETARLHNPLATVHLPIRSSGSRSQGTPVPIDLAYVRTRAVNTLLALHTRGGLDWTHASWGVPGGTTMVRVLEYASFGAPPARWFSQVDPASVSLHPRYRLSASAMRWASVLARVPLPRPVYAPVDDPLPIARWMSDVLKAGGTPHLLAFVSSAVRLCQEARRAGLDLEGARFAVTGEPTTSARMAVIRAAGAEAVPSYASAEAGAIAYGCLVPNAPDDMHLYQDLIAMIQPGARGSASGLPPDALLISSIRSTAPFILLNVSMGDQAKVVNRSCGCGLEKLGWRTHLESLSSFEKLTAGGMTFLDTDVIRVLEQELPGRFGGGPTDYQLLEEEAEDGRPRLRLLVHPRVGTVDEDAVVEALLEAIAGDSGAQRVMVLLWREARLISVEREPPRTAPSGKILHLHVEPAGVQITA